MVERREHIARLVGYRPLPPASQPGLNEVTELAQAVQAISEQPNLPFSTFHVLEIEPWEDSDVTVQRFQNWLMNKKAVHNLPKPDKRGKAVKRRGREFALTNKATVWVPYAPDGRRDPGAMLRALAVRRLKAAGLKRHMASLALKMKQHVLNSDEWEKLPKRAEAAIRERLTDLTELGRLGLID